MSETADLMVQRMREMSATAEARADLLRRQIADLEAEVDAAGERASRANQCSTLVEGAARMCRAATGNALSAALTEALKSVFSDDYSCRIALTMLRSKPAAVLQVKGGGWDEMADPIDSRGGGVIDVLAFASRVAVLEAVQPSPRGLPLILDEPMDALDRSRAPDAGMLIAQLSRTTGRQIIFVTHNRDLAQAADLTVDLDGQE